MSVVILGVLAVVLMGAVAILFIEVLHWKTV